MTIGRRTARGLRFGIVWVLAAAPCPAQDRPVLPDGPVPQISLPPSGLRVAVAATDAGAPVAIESSTSSSDYLHRRLRLRNTSLAAVAAVGVAINLGTAAREGTPHVWRRARVIEIALAPGDVREVEISAFPAAPILALAARENVWDVELGLVWVRFADGRTWQMSVATAWFSWPARGGSASCLDANWQPVPDTPATQDDERRYRRCLTDGTTRQP